MSAGPPDAKPGRREAGCYLAFFFAALLFNLWGVRVGWESHNLPGQEFRQAQTAIAAYYIQQEHDFSLAYPTPVLGPPWSIPLEFPLYQWLAVGGSDLTGLDLTKAGRLVSIGSFYLGLPALFLLLGRWGVPAGRRWLVLAVVLTSGFYVFYSRAFLMETMALAFSLWFWVAFEKAVEERSWRWLVVAGLAGGGAGLVKVTTFVIYVVPAAWWAIGRLRAGWNNGRWRGDLAWMGLAVLGPGFVTAWWLRYALAVRALNPSARFLVEGEVTDFMLGSWPARRAPALWGQIGQNIAGQFSWGAMPWCVLLLALLVVRHRAGQVVQLLAWFCVPLAVFPVLYARHEYYYAANGFLLLVALGLVLVSLAESHRPFWLAVLALFAVTGGQVLHYRDRFFPAQRGISDGGDGLTRSLQGLTRPDEVLVITGQDWNSMTPYYARRRALMIRKTAEQNTAQLDAAFARLAAEKIGALAVAPETKGREELVRRAVALGLDPVPLYYWQGVAVHLPLARRAESVKNILEKGYDALSWGPGVELPAVKLAGQWLETRSLPAYQRRVFGAMRPEPVRFFATFEPILDGSGGSPRFGAHPTTRLVFQLSPGAHRLKTTAIFSPDAYAASLADDQATDGVEITLVALGPGDERTVFFSHVYDPRNNPKERGPQPVSVEFTLARPAEVELFIGPGPDGNATRDWISLGTIEID